MMGRSREPSGTTATSPSCDDMISLLCKTLGTGYDSAVPLGSWDLLEAQFTAGSAPFS
jgi:hypothetical protein